MGTIRFRRRWKPGRADSLRLRRTLCLEPLENRRLLAAVGGTNAAPEANHDEARTDGNVPVEIDVTANDRDSDGAIDRSSVRVRSGPNAGRAEVQADGRVKYTPPVDRFGIDSFVYVVDDDAGAPSNAAVVTVEIRSAWQNSKNRYDVNSDGGFSPIDALLVVNNLNSYGARLLKHPPVPPVEPPPYPDVTGDGYVTPADAIVLINCFNSSKHDSGSAFSPESCPMGPPPVLQPLDDKQEEETVVYLEVTDDTGDKPQQPDDPNADIDMSADAILSTIVEDVHRANLRRFLARQVAAPEFLDPLIDDGIYELEVL